MGGAKLFVAMTLWAVVYWCGLVWRRFSCRHVDTRRPTRPWLQRVFFSVIAALTVSMDQSFDRSNTTHRTYDRSFLEHRLTQQVRWKTERQSYFRGRCFLEIDRMINVTFPSLGNGFFDCATAAEINAEISGRSKTLAEGTRTNRVCLPDPRSTFFGSGSFAPWIKQSATPFAPAAIDKMQSDGRSLGQYPITKKL